MSQEPEPRFVTFAVQGEEAEEASYDLSLIASAEWSETDDGMADLVLHLKDGVVRRHKVMKRTAINVRERVEGGTWRNS